MEELNDAFQEAQDQRMEGLAKDVLDKKTVSAEQSAEILGWLVLNFLTMKRSLWSENKLAEKIQAAIDAHKEKCDAEDGEQAKHVERHSQTEIRNNEREIRGGKQQPDKRES